MLFGVVPFFFFWKRLNLLLPFPLPHQATRKGLVYELLIWFMLYCSECLCFRIASNFLCLVKYYSIWSTGCKSKHHGFGSPSSQVVVEEGAAPVVMFGVGGDSPPEFNPLMSLTHGPSHVLAHTWPTYQ